MLTTVIFIGSLLGLIAILFYSWVFFLRIGLRWVKAEKVTSKQLYKAGGLVFIISIAMVGITEFFSLISPTPLGILYGIVELILPWLIISYLFQIRFKQAIQAWLPTLFSIAIGFMFALPLKAFLLEGYTIPANSNSMAPTILGSHHVGKCKECGNSAFYPVSKNGSKPALEAPLMICEHNFHTTNANESDKEVYHSDTFLSAKYLKPKRWDIVIFKFPGEPSVSYVKRLVGLPGEVITIKEGFAWANGEKLIPPKSLQGLKYLSGDKEYGLDGWGSSRKPAQLADDEYFVLGDFSKCSYDSRYWNGLSESHHPYALPDSHLQGVVTHIYWPPSRWRIFR